MKLAIWNPTSFVGSNFSNYLMLNPNIELLFFLAKENLSNLKVIAGPLASKMRSSIQVSEHISFASDEDLARLQYEEVDYVLCFDCIPKQLKDNKKTIYIGKDYYQDGAARTFIYSNVFGPRQRKGEAIPGFLFESKPLTIKSALYIKELFDQFNVFFESGSKSKVATEDPILVEDFIAALNGKAFTKMQISLAHTLRWYNSNTWFDLK